MPTAGSQAGLLPAHRGAHPLCRHPRAIEPPRREVSQRVRQLVTNNAGVSGDIVEAMGALLLEAGSLIAQLFDEIAVGRASPEAAGHRDTTDTVRKGLQRDIRHPCLRPPASGNQG